MKAGRSLQELAAEIERQNNAKADYLVKTTCLRMEPYDGAPYLHVLDKQGQELVEPLDIRQNAHEQIGTYLNIPRKYYERMRAEDPELLSYNVNRWLDRNPEQRILRTLDGHARAFLSNRYRRIDNYDIARLTLPVISEMQSGVVSTEITENYLYIKVVNPRLETEVTPGDVVQAGVVIRNSETGRGAVSIQPLIYRLVCKNGMTVTEAGTRRNHVGRINEDEENYDIYSPETLKADDEAFARKLCDSVRAAVDEAKFKTVVEKMQRAKGVQLDTGNLPNLIKMTGASLGYTEGEGDGILKYLAEGGDFTLYGFANAVTRYSQDVESYDRASKLEELGYSVLTMSPNLFRVVNQVTNLAA